MDGVRYVLKRSRNTWQLRYWYSRQLGSLTVGQLASRQLGKLHLGILTARRLGKRGSSSTSLAFLGTGGRLYLGGLWASNQYMLKSIAPRCFLSGELLKSNLTEFSGHHGLMLLRLLSSVFAPAPSTQRETEFPFQKPAQVVDQSSSVMFLYVRSSSKLSSLRQVKFLCKTRNYIVSILSITCTTLASLGAAMLVKLPRQRLHLVLITVFHCISSSMHSSINIIASPSVVC